MLSTIPPSGVPTGSVPYRREQRLLFTLVGYATVCVAILAAWVGGAGVTTAPSSFDSGPNPSSLALLFAMVGMLVVGSWVVAGLGSVYGRELRPAARTTEAGTLRGVWSLGRAAIFLMVLGGGLLLMGLALPLPSPLVLCHGLVPCYLSPTVLFVPAILDGVGMGALALGISFLAFGRRRNRSEFRAWWRRTGRYVTVGGMTIVVVVAALLIVPVRQSFSTQLSVYGGGSGGIGFEVFPQGARVTGSWSANPPGLVNFTIQGPSGADIYSSNASSGTFSFTASGVPFAVYTFWGQSASPETVSVRGSFNAPMWSWPPGEPGAPTEVVR
jgi:hypothetical protein